MADNLLKSSSPGDDVSMAETCCQTLMAENLPNSNSTCDDDASLVSKAAEKAILNDSELEFSEDEKTLIARMYNLVGERWSLIAGRIPGRSAEEIQKYWNSRISTTKLN